MTKFLKNADVTGYISQTLVTSSLLKTDSSGKLVAATAGTDYQAPTAALLPTGGSAGQILAKIDATNYNTQWIDNFAQQLKHDVKLGATLAKGKAVYVSSANGTNMIVSAADNSTEATSSKTLGLLETGGVTNDIVKVITEGLLAGLDTSTATAGDPVWLGTNGNLIFGLANKPVAPSHLVFIGIVTRAQSVNGEIFVKVQNGFELDELHNVSITSVANNQGLFYEISAGVGLWKNKTIASVLGYTPANDSNVVKLTGDQTIGGTKTFSSQIITDIQVVSPAFKVQNSGNLSYYSLLLSYSNGTRIIALPDKDGTIAVTSDLASYLPLTGGTLTGALVINPANSSTVGLDLASNTLRLRTDSSQPFPRQLTTTIGSGTLVKMQAAGYGATYVTDLGFYTSSGSAVNTTPNLYLTGGNNRVGINTDTPAYTLDVAGTIGASGAITANSFVKSGGSSLQFLMADGSVSLGATATARTEQIFTATSGQTTFTVTGGYVVGLVDVYINGVKLLPADFTATNGSTVVLGTGAVLNDSVTIINYTATIAALPTSRDVIDYTATSAQTTFTVSGGYTVGLLDVYVNGVKLTSSEYTATNGTTFVLAVASVTGDQVQAIRYNASVNGVSGSGTANYLPKFTASQTLGNSLIQDDGTTVTIGSTDSNLLMPRAATSNNATVNFATGGTTRWNVGLRGLYSADDFYIFNPVLGINYITLSAASSLANFGVAIRASTFTSYTASGSFLNNSSSGTGSTYIRVNNTGGDLRTGIESSAGGALQTGTSAYAAVFGNQANYATQFTTNGTVRMTIAAGGDVSLTGALSGTSAQFSAGTTSSFGFVVTQNSTFPFGSTNGNRIAAFAQNTGDGNGIQIGYDSVAGTGIIAGATNVSGAGLDFYTYDGSSWNTRMRIAKSGNVLINQTNVNTSTPAKLQISGAGNYTSSTVTRSNTSGIYITETSGTSNYGNGLWFDHGSLMAGISSARATTSNWGTDLRFYTHPDTTTNADDLTERMRITSSGNVGIGTTSPQGGAGATDRTLSINSGAGAASFVTGLVGDVKYSTLFTSSSQFTIETNAAIPITFNTNASERMRITQYGNVLVNATTSAYGSLGIGYSFGVKGTNSQTFISIARANQTLDSQGVIVGLDTNSAYFYVHDNIPFTVYTNGAERLKVLSDGPLQFSTIATVPTYNNSIYSYSGNGYLYIQGGSTGLALAGSGNRNNAIYVNSTNNEQYFYTNGSERMRITSGGNVGIGTTNPGTTRLAVNGDMSAGRHFTNYGSVSAPTSTWVNLFQLPTNCNYSLLIHVREPETYSNYTTIAWVYNYYNGGVNIPGIASYVLNQNTSLQISGGYIQGRQASGSTATIYWDVTIFGSTSIAY